MEQLVQEGSRAAWLQGSSWGMGLRGVQHGVAEECLRLGGVRHGHRRAWMVLLVLVACASRPGAVADQRTPNGLVTGPLPAANHGRSLLQHYEDPASNEAQSQDSRRSALEQGLTAGSLPAVQGTRVLLQYDNALPASHGRSLLQQYEGPASAQRYTEPHLFNTSDLELQSPTLNALADTLMTPSWQGPNCTNRTDPACQGQWASVLSDLANMILKNNTAAQELKGRMGLYKVDISLLATNPGAGMGMWMSAFNWLRGNDVAYIPNIWIKAIPSTTHEITSACNEPIYNPDAKPPPPTPPPSPEAPPTRDNMIPKLDVHAIIDQPSITSARMKSGDDENRWDNKELGNWTAGNADKAGLMYPRAYMLMAYRKDWFEALNITPPNTWSEMLSVAAALGRLPQFATTLGVEQGMGEENLDVLPTPGPTPPDKPLSTNGHPGAIPIEWRESFQTWPKNGSLPATPWCISCRSLGGVYQFRKGAQGLPNAASQGLKIMPLCLDLRPFCKGGDILEAIAASVMQSQGMQQGYMLDSMTLDALTDNPGFKHALKIYRQLVALTVPVDEAEAPYDPFLACDVISSAFASGRCAMTLDWEFAMPFISANLTSTATQRAEVYGNVAWAALPGSGLVWNRDSNALEQCDSLLCPWGVKEQVMQYAFSPLNKTTTEPWDPVPEIVLDPKGPDLGKAGARQLGFTPLLVNRAPYSMYNPISSTFCYAATPLTAETRNITVFLMSAYTKATSMQSTFVQDAYTAMKKRLNTSSQAAPATPPKPPLWRAPVFPSPGPRNGSWQQPTPAGIAPLPSPPASTSAPAAISAIPPGVGTSPPPPPATSSGRRLLQRPGTTAASAVPPPPPADTKLRSYAMRTWEPPNLNALLVGRAPGPLPPIENVEAMMSYVTSDISAGPIAPEYVQSWLAATWRARMVLAGNQAPQLLLNPATLGAVRRAISEGTHFLVTAANATIDNTAKGVAQKVHLALHLQPQNLPSNVEFYQQSTAFIGPRPPSPPPLPPSPPPPAQDPPKSLTLLYIVTPIAIVMTLLAFAAGIRLWWRRQANLSWTGDILPPSAGPGTTLLLTDIQDSTTIWEMMPAHVMDEAVSVHHSTIRAVALKHHGYESATEGDSFILAFHSAKSAALFSVEVQQALLLAEWPEEIYEMEVCKPVWAQINRPKTRRDKVLAANGRPAADTMTNAMSAEAAAAAQEPMDEAAEEVEQVESWRKRMMRTWCGCASFRRAPTPAEHAADMCQLTTKTSVKNHAPPNRISLAGSAETGDRSTRQSLAGFFRFSGNGHYRISNPGKFSSPASCACDDPLAGAPNPLEWATLNQNGIQLGNKEHNDTWAAEQQYSGPASNGPEGALPTITSAVEGAVGPDVSPDGGGGSGGEVDKQGSLQANSLGKSGCDQADMRVHDQLLRVAPLAPGGGPRRMLLFRGFRVRIGMASGSQEGDISLNAALGRVKIGGSLAAAAKAIQDAAQGGQVLVTSSTFTQLPIEGMHAQLMAIEMGQHRMKEGAESMRVYQLFAPALMFRAVHLNPVRSVVCDSLGFLEAPYGHAAVCFMTVAGLGMLEAYDLHMTSEAIKTYQKVSQSQLNKAGGYLIESVDGLCLTAFTRPAAAARWALDTIEACLNADWPLELLDHEMGEMTKVPMMALPTTLSHGVSVAGIHSNRNSGSGRNSPQPQLQLQLQQSQQGNQPQLQLHQNQQQQQLVRGISLVGKQDRPSRLGHPADARLDAAVGGENLGQQAEDRVAITLDKEEEEGRNLGQRGLIPVGAESTKQKVSFLLSEQPPTTQPPATDGDKQAPALLPSPWERAGSNPLESTPALAGVDRQGRGSTAGKSVAGEEELRTSVLNRQGLLLESHAAKHGRLNTLKGTRSTSLRNGAVVVYKVLFRGLRIKVGIDYGPVRADLHAVTARVSFRGKVMNRAARIGSAAKSGQVWMSEHAWEVAQDEINLLKPRDRSSAGEGDRSGGPPQFAFEQEREVTALVLGGFKLKGIVDEMQLVQPIFCEEANNPGQYV